MGRLAEDGFIPTRYSLRQTDTAKYADRTERNLLEADGTLIFFRGELSGGTELTRFFCERHGRPFMTVDLARTVDQKKIREWLTERRIAMLNVAGPRESTSPGIAAEVRRLLVEVLLPVTTPAQTGIMT